MWREAPPSVSLYGIVDLGVSYNQVSRAGNAIGGAVNASLVGMVSGVLSGSRWVIKGAEQLSPEWSSSFVLESGINAQDGSIAEEGLTIGRQASLTMTHEQYGSLTLERRGALAYTYLVTIDPFSVSGSQASMGVSFGSTNGVRPNNLALYQMPAIDGWQAGIGYSFNTGFTALCVNGATSIQQTGIQHYSAAYVCVLSKRTDLDLWASYGDNYQVFSTARSSVAGTGMRHVF